MFGHTDITEFTRYRNIPEVARFQDWPMPFTRDHAYVIADDMERCDGPTRGHWVQLGLDGPDGLVGDLAVWLADDGLLAMVGYTLAPEHQGHGYAIEAVESIVAHLFARRRVHRIAATIDPRNLASARVLERTGFRHVGVARSAALVRGEWTDDDRYSLLVDEWRSWVHRPTTAPRRVDLLEVTRERLPTLVTVEAAPSQRDLVAPVLISLAEALVPPVDDGIAVRPWYRAVEADGEIVGFVMVAEPTARKPDPYLWRLVVDHTHQRRGIGRRAVLSVAAEWREQGATRMFVHYVPNRPGSATGFYAGIGFVPTGKNHGGEVEAVLDLTQSVEGV